MTDTPSVEHWLCLAGGNALGAFHVGAVGTLIDAGIPVRRVAGASIGAIVAGLWLGGPHETARERWMAFWNRAADRSVLIPSRGWREMSVLRGLLAGRPRLFRPTLPGFWALYPSAPNDDHLLSPAPMREVLAQLIDFDRLNDGGTRLIVTAVDQQTGEDVVFDTARTRLTVDHLMASSALPLIFPPVEIDGRRLVDAGLSANLPIEALFADRPERDTLCWAIDLWPPTADRPVSPDMVARRLQDIVFSAQSRHALERVSDRLAREFEGTDVSVAIHHMGYDGGDWEIAGKGFDFSAPALERRRGAGAEAMRRALALPPQGPGRTIMRHAFTS